MGLLGFRRPITALIDDASRFALVSLIERIN